jgi:hypothetical protein
MLQLALVAALALVAGYFIGREHLKSQMLSAFAAAAGELSQVLSPSSAKPPLQTAPKPVTPASPLSVSLTGKEFRPDRDANGNFQTEAVTFGVTFSNSDNKPVRAFDGALVFTDLLGNDILSARVEVNEQISALGQLQWSGELNYNKFMSAHQRMRNEPIENIRVSFVTEKILYVDGELTKFEQ